MIIGGDKSAVIENIRRNVRAGELNRKAELDDPQLTDAEADAVLAAWEKYRNRKLYYFVKSRGARAIVEVAWLLHKGRTEFEGLEKLDELDGGAIVTSNHFNPIDSIFARAVLRRKFGKTPYIVSQETNFAMKGMNGYLIRNLRMIPILKRPNYLIKKFVPRVRELVNAGEFVQIYPEEELWFNYRKPRPCKRGSYLFAAQVGAPVVPIFVEMIDLDKDDNEQFVQLKYVVHVLDIIYPDPTKSHKQNSIEMAEKDYAERVACYEKCYGKKLDYKFSYADIAGYKKGIKKTGASVAHAGKKD